MMYTLDKKKNEQNTFFYLMYTIFFESIKQVSFISISIGLISFIRKNSISYFYQIKKFKISVIITTDQKKDL